MLKYRVKEWYARFDLLFNFKFFEIIFNLCNIMENILLEKKDNWIDNRVQMKSRESYIFNKILKFENMFTKVD